MEADSTPPPPQAEEPDANKRKKTLVIVLVLVLILAAIGIGIVAVLSSQPPAPKLGTLLVIPNEVTLDIGGAKLFHARPLSTEGRVLQASQVAVTWSLAPAAVGTIDNATGLDTTFHAVQEGTAVLTATGVAGGVTKTATANITVNPPPFWADRYTVVAPPSAVEADPFDVTVTVYDQVGAVFTGYRGTVHLTTTDTDPRVVVPADYAFDAADAGVHAFAGGFRLYTAGTQTITATDVGNATITGNDQLQVSANQPPNATFTYVRTQLRVDVNGSASDDSDGTITAYAWEWGDGATGAGVTATHTYAAQGLYQLNLTVTDDKGATGLFQQLVPLLGPTAAFTYTRTGHRIDVDATTSSDPDGTIVTYAWNWGDATTGTGVTATHTYAGDGDYTVALTVTDDIGLTGLRSQVARFHQPGASFSLSAVNLTVSVDASLSSDLDGTIVTYAWDWGDTTTGTGVTAVHTYATKGTYTIMLTVTDDIGLPGTLNQTLTVRHYPTAFFTVQVVGLTANVDASGSTDPDGVIVTYAWDWGDTTTGAGMVTSHAYALAGTYLLVLTVTDDDGLTDTFQRPVTVGLGPIAPSISFTLTIDGLNFLLLADATASFDPDGVIVSYQWDWGDTTTGTGVTATHAYAAPGAYTVSLLITDNDALTNTSNQPVSWFPPTARFTLTRNGWSVTGDGTASSDPDGVIASYTWDWGDGNVTTGAVSTHPYGAGGTFTITLNVTDMDGFWHRTSQTVTFNPPTARFSHVRDLFSVTVDASASTDPDGTIVSYAWDWGDTTTGTGVTSGHTYTVENAYTITLTVTDNDLLTDTAAAVVSVGGTTYDYNYYDFFAVEFGEYWDYRTSFYGDLPIGVDCFNATSIADGVCAGTTRSQYPYTMWYPAPGNIRPGNPNANPILYTMYRFNVTGRNSPAYTIDTPVIVPRFGPAIPGGSVQLDWSLDYVDYARANGLGMDTPWNSIPGDNCGAILPGMDGFITEATLTMTMDYATSRKLFGVAGDPATWWAANVNPGCLNYGQLETAYEDWLVAQGGPQGTPGTYDIWNSFEWYYGPFFTDIEWSVTPGPGGTNTTTIIVHHGTWGYEVLLARWFYYGRTTYADALTLGTPPQGWWGMELAWFDGLRMQATISNDFDFYLSSAMGYHFANVGLPGPDGNLGTNDDYSAWNWMPVLTDYIPSSPQHPYSEMDAYYGPDLTYLHDGPGSRKYALQWTYEGITPHVWQLRAGETLTFLFPTTPVTFYDPVASPRLSDPATLVGFTGVMTYDRTRPVGFGSWDGATGMWRVWGPTAFPSPALPLYTDPMPGVWLRS